MDVQASLGGKQRLQSLVSGQVDAIRRVDLVERDVRLRVVD